MPASEDCAIVAAFPSEAYRRKLEEPMFFLPTAIRRTRMSADSIVHLSSSEVPAKSAPEAWFTGGVQIETLSAHEDIATSVLRVSFVPGARTAWHTHPGGQILVVTSGNGLVATREWSRAISVGDVVEIPAGVEHWHGAGAATPMQHLAIQPDAATDWRDPVDEATFADAGKA